MRRPSHGLPHDSTPAAAGHATRPPRTHQGHRRQALDTGTAQRLQQQCLGLVVTVMGRQQHLFWTGRIGQCVIARHARRSLRALAGSVHRIDLAGGQQDAQALAFAAAVLRPGGRLCLQPMIDMNGRRGAQARTAYHHEKIQQDAGIEAAAESDPVMSGGGQIVIQPPKQKVGRGGCTSGLARDDTVGHQALVALLQQVIDRDLAYGVEGPSSAFLKVARHRVGVTMTAARARARCRR